MNTPAAIFWFLIIPAAAFVIADYARERLRRVNVVIARARELPTRLEVTDCDRDWDLAFTHIVRGEW